MAGPDKKKAVEELTGTPEEQIKQLYERVKDAESKTATVIDSVSENETVQADMKKAFEHQLELFRNSLDGVAKSVATLQERVADLEAKNKEQDKALKSAGREIQALKNANPAKIATEEEKKEKAIDLEKSTFQVDGKEYRFTRHRFIWNKEFMTAKAALEDGAMLNDIVKKTGADADIPGAGIIQSVK